MAYRVYLVGGAVRDGLLGLEPRENDWVVVGGRPEDLLEQGYRQVGASFPVFLHPATAEEYALARRERKQGLGYHGFTVDFDPGVTLEEDLLRRDLTVNAMARDENGALIDPYGGRDDLEKRLLRHVSPAPGGTPKLRLGGVEAPTGVGVDICRAQRIFRREGNAPQGVRYWSRMCRVNALLQILPLFVHFPVSDPFLPRHRGGTLSKLVTVVKMPAVSCDRRS